MHLMYTLFLLVHTVLSCIVTAGTAQLQNILHEPSLSINGVNFTTRAFWMRQANAALAALVSPCPFGHFGTVIVNHSAAGLGAAVCIGANSISSTGNPTLHGEIAAINNCTAIFTDPSGSYKFNTSEARNVFSELSLYTNAESCPMCASAIRWAGFKEYIYGTSIETLISRGWGQIRVSSIEIFSRSFDLPYQTRLVGDLLTNETDPYFSWQYNPSYPCPAGCHRSSDGSSCTAS